MLLISSPCHLHTLILLHLLSLPVYHGFIKSLHLNSQPELCLELPIHKLPTDSEPLQLHHKGPLTQAKLNGDLSTAVSSSCIWISAPTSYLLFTYSCNTCLLSVSDNMKSSRNIAASSSYDGKDGH